MPQSFQNVPIIASLYQCYASFHEVLIGFPKSERYSLGATIQQELLDVLRSCLAAAGTSDSTRKQRELERASVNLDTLRLLMNLAKDSHCISNQTYQQLDSKLSEIGRMLGGWLKSISSTP